MSISTADPITDCLKIVRRKWDQTPRAGIVLGTGLGGFVDRMEIEATFERADLPHFPPATAMSHRGRLVCGRVGSTPIVVMEGRFHVYEGHSLDLITLPVRLMRMLGIDLLILTNASGGLNPDFRAGNIVMLTDHMNFMGTNPLIGPNDDRFGPRFPDISETYSHTWRTIAADVAERENIDLKQGVYAAVTGPNYETKAEVRFFRMAGADVIGMSTVPEALIASHAGLPVLAFSVVTNECLAPTSIPVRGEDVVAVANAAAIDLQRLILGVISKFSQKQI
ncbi:MAG: purine-nucleoside phosphorylase [Planctomycetota bacterium]